MTYTGDYAAAARLACVCDCGNVVRIIGTQKVCQLICQNELLSL